eukprot:6447816-Amphidinium_carterae.2
MPRPKHELRLEAHIMLHMAPSSKLHRRFLSNHAARVTHPACTLNAIKQTVESRVKLMNQGSKPTFLVANVPTRKAHLRFLVDALLMSLTLHAIMWVP